MTWSSGPGGWALGGVAGIGVSAFALLGARWDESNLRVRKGPPEPPPSTANLERLGVRWEQVQIGARDGVRLHGWFLRPRSGHSGCVVVLHGIGGARWSTLDWAPPLLSQGYSLLAPDNRGMGESGGEIVTYGVREADDAHRWVDWLQTSERPRNIFGLGLSLGAQALLHSLALETRFRAVVADSPFSELRRVTSERLAKRVPLPGSLAQVGAASVVGAGFAYGWLRYGVDLRLASPLAAVRSAKTPVLLIHGAKDIWVPPWHAQLIAAQNPEHVQLWLVPAATHAEAIKAAPDDYWCRVHGWFADHARRAEQ